MSKSIVLYLHVHQPLRIRGYSVFDSALSHDYFSDKDMPDHQTNEFIFKKVCEKSYRPMNAVLEKMLAEHPKFKFSLSITGTFIEQAQVWAPDVIESFQRLVRSGRVEILAETYYHSLAFFYSQKEFEQQVKFHQAKIKEVFGVETTALRNTELAYNNDLAVWADKAGFDAIISEGWDPILQWRSPNYAYHPTDTENIKLLMKNYRLSDDIAFRFSNRSWKEWPLTTDKYLAWVNESAKNGDLINLFMDYETFGEHQWADTGVFGFFESLVSNWLAQSSDNNFNTITEAANNTKPAGEISMPHTITWADSERDLSAWLGNDMQHEVMKYIYELEESALATEDIEIIADWRRLQTSDHAYYMCTKWFSDGDVHAYFSPYNSPFDAFLYYMNALRDLRWRIDTRLTGGV